MPTNVNKNLHQAKNAKKDVNFTQLPVIENIPGFDISKFKSIITKTIQSYDV